jgi:hypothetical protein
MRSKARVALGRIVLSKRERGRSATWAKRSHPRRPGRYLLHRSRSAAGRVRPPDLRVYYLPAGAKVPVLIDGMVARPNGLTLTTDGKTLIVDDTIGPTVFAYDVHDDGSGRCHGAPCDAITLKRAMPTPTGVTWSAVAVMRVRERLGTAV